MISSKKDEMNFPVFKENSSQFLNRFKNELHKQKKLVNKIGNSWVFELKSTREIKKYPEKCSRVHYFVLLL